MFQSYSEVSKLKEFDYVSFWAKKNKDILRGPAKTRTYEQLKTKTIFSRETFSLNVPIQLEDHTWM